MKGGAADIPAGELFPLAGEEAGEGANIGGGLFLKTGGNRRDFADDAGHGFKQRKGLATQPGKHDTVQHSTIRIGVIWQGMERYVQYF